MDAAVLFPDASLFSKPTDLEFLQLEVRVVFCSDRNNGISTDIEQTGIFCSNSWQLLTRLSGTSREVVKKFRTTQIYYVTLHWKQWNYCINLALLVQREQ